MDAFLSPQGPSRRRLFSRAAVIALVASVVTVAVAAPAWAHPVLHITASPTTVVAGNNTTITISGTSNGNYTGARIDVSSTGGPGTLPSFTGFVSCAGGPTCSEVGSVYRLALPALANGQAFSYTITLKIDASTAPTTFTSKAQFYKSDNTTDGPTTGPVITVTAPPQADVFLNGVTARTAGGFLVVDGSVLDFGPDNIPDVVVTLTATTSGFSLTNVADSGCVSGTPTSTCDLGPMTTDDVLTFAKRYTVPLLATGSVIFTVTATAVGAIDPEPGDTTATITCNYLLGITLNCA